MALTYNGSTSTAPNTPIEMFCTMNGSMPNSGGLTGGKLWFYSSTNLVSDLTAPGAIADGYALGMRTGDIVLGVSGTAGSSSPIGWLGVVGLQSSGSTLSPGWLSSGVSLSSNFVTSTAV